MAHTVAEPCVNVKDHACVEQCPVECFYEGVDQLYIHPDECIDCGACVAVCPVAAIFANDDVPEQWKSYIDKNAKAFTGTHADDCKCGSCDPATHAASGQLPKSAPKGH